MDRNRFWGQLILVPKDPCPCWRIKLKLLIAKQTPKMLQTITTLAAWSLVTVDTCAYSVRITEHGLWIEQRKKRHPVRTTSSNHWAVDGYELFLNPHYVTVKAIKYTFLCLMTAVRSCKLYSNSCRLITKRFSMKIWQLEKFAVVIAVVFYVLCTGSQVSLSDQKDHNIYEILSSNYWR
jgi:hypothetical protein